MKALLVALAAFAVTAVAVVALAQREGRSSSRAPAASTTSMPTSMASAGMMGTGTPVTTREIKLGILHVQRGCHVWRDGNKQSSMMRMTVRRGGALSIVDQDVDAHQLVQVAGPPLHMPGPMMMGSTGRVRFMQPGTYRLATRTVEIPGNSMPEVKTTGPDNHLRLTVTVI